jgi:hypothetical protein
VFVLASRRKSRGVVMLAIAQQAEAAISEVIAVVIAPAYTKWMASIGSQCRTWP